MESKSVKSLVDGLLRKYDTAFHFYYSQKSPKWYLISEEIYSDIIRLNTSNSPEVVQQILQKKYF